MKQILPFRNAKTETNKTSPEQLLLQEQRSLFPRMYCTVIDLIFDSDILKVERLLVLLTNLFRRCSKYKKTANSDDGNSAMHLKKHQQITSTCISNFFTQNKYVEKKYNNINIFLFTEQRCK